MAGNKKGLLITGGLAPQKKWFDLIRDKYDIIVAADSGIETAMKMDTRVDYVVGDMDSIGDVRILDDFPDGSVHRFNQDKDYTDTELGLSFLQEHGCGFCCIYGGGGGRLDHLIGILSLFDREEGPEIWITDSAVVVSIRDAFVLKNMEGRTVSFFPMGVDRCTMTSSGLKWPLDPLEWCKGDTGISNLAISDDVEVTMRSGRLAFVGELETMKGLRM